MKWAWRWTLGISVSEHFSSPTLIQPSPPFYFPLLHAMGLHTDS